MQTVMETEFMRLSARSFFQKSQQSPSSRATSHCPVEANIRLVFPRARPRQIVGKKNSSDAVTSEQNPVLLAKPCSESLTKMPVETAPLGSSYCFNHPCFLPACFSIYGELGDHFPGRSPIRWTVNGALSWEHSALANTNSLSVRGSRIQGHADQAIFVPQADALQGNLHEFAAGSLQGTSWDG